MHTQLFEFAEHSSAFINGQMLNEEISLKIELYFYTLDLCKVHTFKKITVMSFIRLAESYIFIFLAF